MKTYTGSAARLAFIAALLLVAWYFRSTVMLVFLAGVLAIIMSMPANAMIRRGAPRWLALSTGVLTCLIGLILIFATVLPALVQSISQIAGRYDEAVKKIDEYYNKVRETLTFLPDSSSLFTASDTGSSGDVVSELLQQVGNIGGGLTQSVVVFVIAIFFLIAPQDYRAILRMLLPDGQKERASEVLDMMNTELRAWLRTLSMSIGVTFGLTLICFSVIGFPFTFELAVIVGVATIIPTIGAIIPVIPIVIFGLTGTNPWIILIALPVYLAIQMLESNVITPSLMKENLNLLPAGTMVFQIVAAQIFGFIGIFLAVPVLVVLVVLVREYYCRDYLGQSIPSGTN